MIRQENNKKNILLVNDSYFSYLLAKELIINRHYEIDRIIFSESTTGSYKKVFKIFKKASKSFFFYRVFVFILTKFIYRKRSIKYLASKYNIASVHTRDLKEFTQDKYRFDTGFAFNFDIVIRKQFLNMFTNGIYNIHASRLPQDKGISPVLWAFARGDREIWSSIYKMDAGIDTGDIFKQFAIGVKEGESAFSLYSRVCKISGKELFLNFDTLLNDNVKLEKQPILDSSSYLSWPDQNFDRMMKQSNRELFKISDLKIKI